MPSYLHPGVYVEEIPSSSRPIASASTSIPIFAGSTDRGPIGEPQFILKWGDYVKEFGGIQDATDYMGLSINSYFMNGGGPAYVARLRMGANKSASLLHHVQGTTNAGTRLINFEASSAGDWGDNLFLIVSNSAAMTFDLTVYLKKGIEYELAESFANLGMNSNKPNFVGHVLAVNSKYLTARYSPRLPAATTAGLKGVGSVQSPVYANPANIVKKGTYEFSISLDGGPMKTVEVVLADAEITVAAVFPKLNSAIGLDATVTAPGGNKILIISDDVGPNASVVVSGELAKQLLLTAPTATFVYGESSFIPGNHGPVDDPKKDLNPADPSTSLNLTGGGDGSDPDLSSFQTLFDDPMSKIRDISIILLPGQTLDGGPGQAIIDAAIANCEKTKSRMVIIDPPVGTADPKTLPLPTKTYSVLYYPWLRVANPLFHPEKNPSVPPSTLIPPSGAAAGMWAKTDSKRGVWKAPAGVATGLLGIVGTEVEIPDAIQDQLNPLGINCIRNIPRFNYVFWGARTLATNSAPEWRYVPIRRTAIMIERSIYDGIQWAVFEPNNHKLWASLRLNIENFMDGLFRAGAFQGEKASDAYFVRCNLGDTMTQADIDNGQVIVEVGFAPLKPAEFVIVRIQQIVGQAR